jgi:hypothetical protein
LWGLANFLSGSFFILSNLEGSRAGNVRGGTMKKAVLALLITLPLGLQAQQNGADAPAPEGTVPTSITFPVEKVQKPTTADLNCAGFISKHVESKDKYVAGGLDSAFTTQYANGEAIFLNGKGYELGQQYEIVRELVDPNRYELFPGQWASLKATGQPYEELARVQVVDTRHKMAVARVEYSCNTVLPGDFVIPYVQKTDIAFHPPMRFDRFVPASGTSGRIVLAKDFDSELGNGGKVYLNIGSNQGLKVGDYLRASRSYEATAHDSVDSLSFKSPAMEPTQAKQPSMDSNFLSRTNGPEIHVADMPRRSVGEVVILGVTPTTATGMIVFSLEPVHVGDRVELEQQ